MSRGGGVVWMAVGVAANGVVGLVLTRLLEEI